MDAGKVIQALLKNRFIDQQTAIKIREEITRSKKSPYKVIQEMGIMTEEQLLKVLSREFKVQIAETGDVEVDPTIVQLVPREFCEQNEVFPLRRKGRILYVAMADPTKWAVIDNLRFLTNLSVEPLLMTPDRIGQLIIKAYGEKSEVSELAKEMAESVEVEELQVVEEKEEEELADAAAAAKDSTVQRYVQTLLKEAIEKRASDIHIEPFEKKLRIRLRIDGVLREIDPPHFKYAKGIVSVIKIMSNLKIEERRLPQDGHLKIKDKLGRVIDFRVSTLPVKHGEKVVLRILDKSSLTLDLKKLGFEPDALRKFEYAITRPYGMILVTGPTGSGKTTTLYSALSILNKPEVNIMTAEDPVEFEFEGINQVQVREEIGLTFAAALRSFLRQDPDIIMVGEIRDSETASIAVKAALTGHLVLSTLHTNDAPSTIARLVDMGIPPYLIADSLILVMAQRLVRKLCPQCKRPVKPSEEKLRLVGLDETFLSGKTVYGEGEGSCDLCRGSRYKGREGIYEVMLITPTLREYILEGRPIHEIREKAREEGMLTLREAALLKFQRGITSLEEVIRVTMEG
ncbi:MAG: type IV-A pilus assembly ATPase PilB [candidate division WOR-3 bacterium]